MYVSLKFFTTFKNSRLKVPIMLTLFQKLKLWFVRQSKFWNTCCCRYHMELKELVLSVNEMRMLGKGVHDACECQCTTVRNAHLQHANSLVTKCYANLPIFSD
jgi:hypothetical protein